MAAGDSAYVSVANITTISVNHDNMPINRFSEDVDLTLDYRAFDDEFDPFVDGASNTDVKKFRKRLKGYLLQYAAMSLPHISVSS